MNDSQEKTLSASEKGEEGERAVNAKLKDLEPEYRLIEDVYLRTYEYSTPKLDSIQIDHILLSIYGIFVIETKNMEGRISGSCKDKEWTQELSWKYYKFQNPILQNDWHRKVLAKHLKIDADCLFSIVVFVGGATLSKKTNQTEVCYIKNLKNYIRSFSNEERFERKEIDSFYTTIKKNNLRLHDKNYKANHEEFVQTRKSIRDGEARDNQTNETPAQKIAPDDRFAEAKSNHFKKTRKFIGYSSLTIFVALLSGVLAYLFFQPQSRNAEVIQPHQDIESGTDGQVFREQSLTGTSSISLVQDARRQFMQQLAQYENEIEPKINEIQLNNWDGEKHAELNQLKVRAIEHFSKGEYLLAREGLQQARAMAAEASAEYVSRLATAKREANEAFENNQAPEAGKAIQQALRLSPADSEMLALQKRVGVLSQVLDLLRQAGVAQNENRPEKEVVALQKVLSIDRSRGQIKSRLQKLRAQLKQQQFSSVLSKAQSALDAGNLADAKKQIAVAKTIFPASKVLGPLQNRLQQMQAEREFAEQISRGEQAVQRDDWQAAAKSFGRARQLKPNNKTAIENHNSAQQVVNSTQQIGLMLVQEHRLGDKNIVNSVAAYLREVEPVAGLSSKLQKIHAELARKVDLYKTEVDVVVVSDNATYIIVRGEGQVGKTSRRTIRLRPGKRVFEGSRAGYKSKLVTLDIKPGMPPLEITIICDEKI